MGEALQLWALFLQRDQLLHAHPGLQNRLAPDLLDLQDQLLVPLLVLLSHLLLICRLNLNVQLVDRGERLVKVLRGLVANRLVINLLD